MKISHGIIDFSFSIEKVLKSMEKCFW